MINHINFPLVSITKNNVFLSPVFHSFYRSSGLKFYAKTLESDSDFQNTIITEIINFFEKLYQKEFNK